mgnify:CR=1 FL=1
MDYPKNSTTNNLNGIPIGEIANRNFLSNPNRKFLFMSNRNKIYINSVENKGRPHEWFSYQNILHYDS